MATSKIDTNQANTPSSYPTREMKELFHAILSLQDEEEAVQFFRDLCTMSELKEMANRWQIVLMLYERKPYIDIASELQVSTTTVARVAQWLHEGKGYQPVADRIALVQRAKNQEYTVKKTIARTASKILKLRK